MMFPELPWWAEALLIALAFWVGLKAPLMRDWFRRKR